MNQNYPTREVKILSLLEHVCARPKMYFGDTSTTSIELAAFLNGWMAHRSDFMYGGFAMACRADPDKSPEENGKVFLEQILDWEKDKPGTWRCCVDAPKGAEEVKLTEKTDAELEALIRSAKKEQRRRNIAALLAEECLCDRYTCGRCQALERLHYDPKKDTGGKAV